MGNAKDKTLNELSNASLILSHINERFEIDLIRNYIWIRAPFENDEKREQREEYWEAKPFMLGA